MLLKYFCRENIGFSVIISTLLRHCTYYGSFGFSFSFGQVIQLIEMKRCGHLYNCPQTNLLFTLSVGRLV